MVSTCPAFSRPALASAKAAAVTTTTRCMSTATASVSRSSGQLSAFKLTPCTTAGVKAPRRASREVLAEMDMANTKLIKELMKIGEERDITIARLEFELAEVTRNWEGQIEQLMWLNGVVNQKEFDQALTVSALEDTVSDQANTIKAMQSKFDAIYNHCKNLALDRQRKKDYIATLLSSEEKAKQISLQQHNLTKSLLALKEKKRKTRFIDGQHSLHYGETEPSPKVKQEMDLAAARIKKVKEQQDRADLIKLSDAVDRLALKYDRYNMITSTKVHNTRCDPDGLPCIVPRDMMGLWLFADMMEEPTQEENAMYEFHLQLQVRPPPIYSPNLPKPTVNWTTLNKHKRKNLPDPEIFPVQSVPTDPNFYLDLTKYKTVDHHRTHDYTGPIPLRITKEECGCARCVPPFGQMYGLMTDMGVIPMPDTSVHGYRWDDMTGSWVIATGG